MSDRNEASPNFTLYPLFWLAVCFAFGTLSGNFLNFGWQIYLTICLLSAVLSAVFIKRTFTVVFLYIAFVAVGALYFQIENQTISPNRVKRLYDETRIKSGDPIEIEGVLQTRPELAVGGFFLILKTEKAIYKEMELNISGNIRLFTPVHNEQIKSEYDRLDLNYGSRIRIACNLRREDSYLNAGVVSHKQLLDQKQIDAVAIIKSPLLVEKIEDTETFAPLAWLYERRQNLIIDFRDNFNVSTAGILIASLLGNGHFLDKPTAEVFREGGTFHVLVISGLHITFIGGLTLLFIRFFTNKRLWQFLTASIFLWSYSLAVGADVPVVRATIMFTILLFSQVLYRSGTLLNSLGFCALILLVWRPNDIFSSSFQLTFVSIGAIVAMAFPLIEKLRAIGRWSPSSDAPFPPQIPLWLKRFCEMLYWREKIWEREVSRQLWAANLFKSPYLKWLESRNLQSISGYIFEAILVSLIVQAWLLPFIILYFHRLSMLSVFLNLWVGVIIALESFAAVFAVFLANFSSALALPFTKLTEILNWLLVSVPNFFTENNWASARLPVYSGNMRAVYVLYFAPIIVLSVALNFWNPFSLGSKLKTQNSKFDFLSAPLFLRASAFVLLILSAVIIFHPFSSPSPDGRLHIDFLDVGQGDSALITFPNGETLMVDGGGKININKTSSKNEYEDEPEIFEPDTQTIGEMVVSNFLWEKGYSQVDYILATHADSDHIQGLLDVAKNFRVRAAIFGRTPMKDTEFAELYSVMQKRRIESITISRGDVLTFDAVKIEVLYPEKNDNLEAVSDNNHSLVLRLIYGDRKFLLTGDIEKETETFLLNMPVFLQTDLIKVAHHGSRTSSIQQFVNAAKAKVAVISVGRESPFGHPHEEVVERWKNTGAKVLTTGENGTISVSTDGRDLQLKTFNKEKFYR
ncbi:MAG: ComEC/Rec2 family competence protein [Acidobacteria bacterium]|nr:ComEC/Rec2 family competence protein [Acidobacteriota bacterium]